MTEFTSNIKTIPHNSEDVFRVLSDFSKLKAMEERIREKKIKELKFDSDSCFFRIEPIGEICFRIIEREPHKLIKLKSENIPFELFIWIQLLQKEEKDTKMKITLRAELNPFIKNVLIRPIKEGVEKISDALAAIPYHKIP